MAVDEPMKHSIPLEDSFLPRRNFLKGLAAILAAGVAPAAIGSNILMPVRKLWTYPAGGYMEIYEEGAFTPTIIPEVNGRFFIPEGIYTRIGNIVTVTAKFTLAEPDDNAWLRPVQWKP